jgi:3-dehydroquinate synthase
MSTPTVRGSKGDCPIHIGWGSLETLGPQLKRAVPSVKRVMVAADHGVRDRWLPVARVSLQAAGLHAFESIVQASEEAKTMAAVERLWQDMLAAGLQRGDAVVALGGGIVGDLAGFAAATFLRGVPLVMAPTTLLAMVDASIGGKTGVNMPLPGGGLGKNLAGAFHQPAAVVADPQVLTTLEARDFRCGLAECVKHALIADPRLLEWIEANAGALIAGQRAPLETLVDRSARIKAEVVSRDEFERGERAHLNLGHTFGHALEALLHEALRHGEAVALGLVAAVAASREAGWWPQADVDGLRRTLAFLGLPVTVPGRPDRSALVRAMGFDKKAQGGRQRLVLLRGPGLPGVLPEPDPRVVEAGWSAIGA